MKSRHSDLKQICQQFGVIALYAFGSQAKKIKDWMEGRQDDIPLGTSDVDIRVRVISGANFSVTEKAKLSLSLEDLFDSNRVVEATSSTWLIYEKFPGRKLRETFYKKMGAWSVADSICEH